MESPWGWWKHSRLWLSVWLLAGRTWGLSEVGVIAVDLAKSHSSLCGEGGKVKELREQWVCSQRQAQPLGPQHSAHPHQARGEETQDFCQGRGYRRNGQREHMHWTLCSSKGRTWAPSLCLTLWMPLGKTFTFTCLTCRVGRRMAVLFTK